jgi:hypothetical protein
MSALESDAGTGHLVFPAKPKESIRFLPAHIRHRSSRTEIRLVYI